MDRFASLRAFVAVVEAGGFAPAARRLGLATSSVTRQVDALEDGLSAKLLNRSTRSVTLTDPGRGYFEKAVRLLSDLEEADLSVADAGALRGLLRISAPLAFGRLHLAPILADYLRLAPEVQLDLLFTDGLTNLAEENVDIAIRIGALEPSSLVARKLAGHRRVVCASSAYLARAGAPRVPQELADHACLTFAYAPGRSLWRFAGTDGADDVAEVAVAGPLRANSSESLVELALAGCGVVLMPTWLVGDHLKAGRLQPLLTAWQANPGAGEAGIHAVFLANRRGAPKVRSFLDFLAARWRPNPPWEI